MSNRTTPTNAKTNPASLRRTTRKKAPLIASRKLENVTVDFFGDVPSWMALTIEMHRDAAGELARRSRELEALTAASSAIDPEAPPAWFLEAEQARDLAASREVEAMKALLIERPCSLEDVQDRARYLVCSGIFRGQGAMIATLLTSMTGGEG